MSNTPWTEPMNDETFAFMREVVAAPSPVGLEAAMTMGVLKPRMEEKGLDSWKIHQFVGNAGIVQDTHPGRDDMLKIMLIGHADKIRLQVRSISDDGKIYVNSDSFLSGVLIGHEMLLFSEDPKNLGSYRVIKGGTVEAIGAIHFSSPAQRAGDSGIKKKQLYLELGFTGKERKKQVTDLGIKPGDTLLMDRPIRKGFAKNSFYGAYLDNGLGCFAVAEISRLIAEMGGLENVRVLFAMASHEEIGRFGSRVQVQELRPDIIIAIDVNHDYASAPGISDRRMPPLEMGKGFTISVGAIVSAHLNQIIMETANKNEIPFQHDLVGRDTGTDGMAGALAGIDVAATSIGFPIRNMHTISECGHTGDVLASIYAVFEAIKAIDEKKMSVEDFKQGHPRLDQVTSL